MARHHELAGDVKQAIHFYTRAGAYNNVIRICKEHGFEDQLFNVALLSQPRDMLLAADHFQKNESTLDKAVLLYHRAGNLAKAIDLVFQQQRFGVLEQLVDELDHSAPPEVLSRCAKFFLEHGRSAKAAHLFILSKSYPRAMQIIIEEDVDMSPRMVELLNLPPGKLIIFEKQHRNLNFI
jgi:intraflagellar transport protein 140